MNRFKPFYQLPIESYTHRLQELMEEDARLESEVKELWNESLRNKKLPRSERRVQNDILDRRMAKRNLRRKAIKAEIERLQTELKERLDAPEVAPFADEFPATFNECVGHWCNFCIYVRDDGELVYREASSEDKEKIGDACAYPDALHLISELHPPIIEAICNELYNNINTPFWAQELYFKKEIQA